MFEFVEIIAKGGPVMVPLLLCSVISLAVTIERWIFWRRTHSKEAAEEMLALVERGEFARALDLGHEANLPVTRVLTAGLSHRNLSLAKALEAATQAELPALKKYLPMLDTIVTLAPLLGLLGTVVGMISSFDIMSEAGIGQPHAVTGGVAEALIATATGLLIAILTLVPYNYFSSRLEQEIEAIEAYASRLEMLLSARED